MYTFLASSMHSTCPPTPNHPCKTVQSIKLLIMQSDPVRCQFHPLTHYFRHSNPITDPQAISYKQKHFTYNNDYNIIYFLVNKFRISGPQQYTQK